MCVVCQNDSLRVELPVLLEDVDAQGLSLGNEAFNNTPEAVTSTHLYMDQYVSIWYSHLQGV